MRILFLDDDPARHRIFGEANIGHNVHHVWTAQEAVEALALNERYDVASLDHDLAVEDQMCDPDGRTYAATGYDVVKRMVDPEVGIAAKLPKTVVVHSFNPAGAKRMVETLQAAGCVAGWFPFRGQRIE